MKTFDLNKKYTRLINTLGAHKVLLNEPLNKYSSFKLGGPADLFYKAFTKEELILSVKSARILEIPYFLMGSATNLLISDSGFRGIIIKNETHRINILAAKGNNKVNTTDGNIKIQKIYIEAESGVSVNRLVRFALEQGYSGLEFFLGQPGSIGGAVWINAHNMKMGKFIGDSIVGATILNSENELKKVTQNFFKFSYDNSILQKTKDIVISVIFELTASSSSQLWETAKKALLYRGITQPRGVYSSGCIFRNIKNADAIRIASPNYTRSAGFLLESAGLKNKCVGEACFSDSHTNFIVHRGNSKTADVIKLINIAREKIKKKYNIDLTEEIVRVGDFHLQ